MGFFVNKFFRKIRKNINFGRIIVAFFELSMNRFSIPFISKQRYKTLTRNLFVFGGGGGGEIYSSLDTEKFVDSEIIVILKRILFFHLNLFRILGYLGGHLSNRPLG